MKAIQLDLHPIRWPLCKVIGMVRPAVFWGPLSGLRLRDIDMPPLPGEDWVRIRPLLGGICGTDLTAIFQRNHPASIVRCFTRFPLLLGHEGVGVIESVGDDVADWQPGQRVVVEPMLSCVPRGIDPPCPPCREGHFSLCENLTEGDLPPAMMIGLNPFTGGTWGESFVAHRSQLLSVPDSADDETATLVDPIACSVHAVLRHTPPPGANVIILGAGIIGLGLAASLRALAPEVRVTALVRHDHQQALMERFGASEVIRVPRKAPKAERYDEVAARTGGRRYHAMFGNQALVGGYDVSYDCIGTGDSLTDALKFVHARGTVVQCATSTITVVDTTPLWMAELNVVGCYGRAIETFEGRPMHTYDVVFELLRRGQLDLTGLLTHTFRIGDYRQALRMLTERGSSAVVKTAFDHR